MQFNVGVKSISISAQAKKVYEELEKIRPNHISFSLMLAIAADEYIKLHKKGVVKLDDFVTETPSPKTPLLDSDIEHWIEYIYSSDNKKFKDIQERLLQIQNIIDARCGF